MLLFRRVNDHFHSIFFKNNEDFIEDFCLETNFYLSKCVSDKWRPNLRRRSKRHQNNKLCNCLFIARYRNYRYRMGNKGIFTFNNISSLQKYVKSGLCLNDGNSLPNN